MACRTARGQVVTEIIWTLVLFISFSVFVLKLFKAAEAAQQQKRWEIEKEHKHER